MKFLKLLFFAPMFFSSQVFADTTFKLEGRAQDWAKQTSEALDRRDVSLAANIIYTAESGRYRTAYPPLHRFKMMVLTGRTASDSLGYINNLETAEKEFYHPDLSLRYKDRRPNGPGVVYEEDSTAIEFIKSFLDQTNEKSDLNLAKRGFFLRVFLHQNNSVIHDKLDAVLDNLLPRAHSQAEVEHFISILEIAHEKLPPAQNPFSFIDPANETLFTAIKSLKLRRDMLRPILNGNHIYFSMTPKTDDKSSYEVILKKFSTSMGEPSEYLGEVKQLAERWLDFLPDGNKALIAKMILIEYVDKMKAYPYLSSAKNEFINLIREKLLKPQKIVGLRIQYDNFDVVRFAKDIALVDSKLAVDMVFSIFENMPYILQPKYKELVELLIDPDVEVTKSRIRRLTEIRPASSESARYRDALINKYLPKPVESSPINPKIGVPGMELSNQCSKVFSS